MSGKRACNAQTYTQTKAGVSPAAKAASLVLAAGLALPTVLPTLAHAQNASSTQESTPSLHKAAEVNSRSTAALIRQSLQNAKTAAELQAVLAAAQEAYNQSEAEYDKAAAPYDNAVSNRDAAAQTYSNEKSAASKARDDADAALANEIEKAQAAADAGEKELANARTTLSDAKLNAAEKQKAYDEALNKATEANEALAAAKEAA
ncbi:MAG: hypothetical protein U0I00_03580, partial [Eggerthellaceae bacterium]|nr:hypothetical protein [Eggerthellaceae bacterium]